MFCSLLILHHKWVGRTDHMYVVRKTNKIRPSPPSSRRGRQRGRPLAEGGAPPELCPPTMGRGLSKIACWPSGQGECPRKGCLLYRVLSQVRSHPTELDMRDRGGRGADWLLGRGAKWLCEMERLVSTGIVRGPAEVCSGHGLSPHGSARAAQRDGWSARG